MTVLDPPFAITVTPQRSTTTILGATTWTDLPETAMVVALNAATILREGAMHYTQDGVVFVPRDSGLQPGDRIPYNNTWFVLYGQARGNQVHPFTGDDFGWMQFAIHSVD